MKPTVINNNTSEQHSAKPNQEQHSADTSNINNPNVGGVGGVGGISGNAGINTGGNDSRRFPQFRVSEQSQSNSHKVGIRGGMLTVDGDDGHDDCLHTIRVWL